MEEKRFPQTSESILARIAYKIRIALNVDTSELRKKVARFVNSLSLGGETKLYYTRMNLVTELSKSTMTFKVFMKLLRVISAERIDFSVTVYIKGGKTVTIEDIVHLNALGDTDETDKKS